MPHSVEAEAHLGTYRSTDLGSDSKHATKQRTQSPGKAWALSARPAGNAGTLLSDLQDYVLQLESTADWQRAQISQLKDEKRDVERVLNSTARAQQERSLPHFQASELAELPPRLRALFEDNKLLKDKVRKYKARAAAADKEAAEGRRAAQAAELEAEQLRDQLAENAYSLSQAAQARSLRAQLEEAHRANEKLQQKAVILQQKVESDERAHRLALAGAARERAAADKAVEELRGAVAASDKQARAQTLAAKQAARKFDAARAALAQEQAAAIERARAQAATEVAQARREAASGVHLMLVLIRDPTAGAQGAAAAAAAPAGCAGATSGAGGAITAELADVRQATQLPPVAAGHRRPRVHLACRFPPEQAATVVQAAVRGHLARRRVAAQRRAAAAAAGALAVTAGQGPDTVGQLLALAGESPEALQEGAAADVAGPTAGEDASSAAEQATTAGSSGAAPAVVKDAALLAAPAAAGRAAAGARGAGAGRGTSADGARRAPGPPRGASATKPPGSSSGSSGSTRPIASAPSSRKASGVGSTSGAQ